MSTSILLYDGAMFNRRRAPKSEVQLWEIPEGTLDLLEILDAEYLLLAPGEVVLNSSRGTSALGLVRDSRVTSESIKNLVRAVRRSNIFQEATVELPRGPVGEGTHDLLVRVSPFGNNGLVIVLIFDDSEFRRLDSIRRDFVANISHELKTPIGALSILSEAVLGASDDPEAVVRFAGRMQVEAKRLSDLVQEIINLSRLQDDDPLVDAKVIPIADLIRQAIDESKLTAESRKISVAFDCKIESLVLGDRGQLEMAISNLVENAINYSPDATQVAVTLSKEEGLVEISVKDQGIGIPEKDLERIFERFYRVDPARSRATGGTGLGLSIVKHVATNHGGDISVWSAESAGSTFTLRLPEYVDSIKSLEAM